MTRTYIDDNFGVYDIDCEEDVEFYHRVQEESVEKICRGCERRVLLRPDYGYCSSCADRRERGEDL